ncbi:MAG: YegP family protein [Gammaproteobacteria bacterium]
MAAKYVITKSNKNKQYYFRLQAANGQAILQSEGYPNMNVCMNGINSVQECSSNDSLFESKVAKNGQHYFVLTAKNGQTIGRSEMYKATAGCKNGIASVKRNGPGAKVDDQSQ